MLAFGQLEILLLSSDDVTDSIHADWKGSSGSRVCFFTKKSQITGCAKTVALWKTLCKYTFVILKKIKHIFKVAAVESDGACAAS